jgi:outer membrane protein
MDMRTSWVICLLLLAGLSLSGCAGSKVAVVNSARIFQESDAGKSGLAYLEQVEKDVKAKAENAQRIAESLPDAESMSAALQQYFVTCQESMNAAQQQAVTAVQGLINRSLVNYRERNGIAVILQNEAVLGLDPAADATDEVIRTMNMEPLSFAPIDIADFTPPAPGEK